MKETKEKSKALSLAIEKLEKTYGQGTIMKLSDENIVKIPSIPCLLYTSPSPRDRTRSRMPSSA